MTKLIVANSNAPIFSSDQMALIRNTVAKGCTNDEMQLFVHLAQKYDLDPFAKEIWCIKRNATDPALIMTARDGYLKIANRTPEFDGMTSGVVREGDIYMRTDNGGVMHQHGEKRGQIIGAFALVKRKDRTLDSYGWAEFSEYKGNATTWNKYPSAMIIKVAEAFALKRAFTINGLVTVEEMDSQLIPASIEIVKPEATATTPTPIPVTPVAQTAPPLDDIEAALAKGDQSQQLKPEPVAPITDPATGQQIAIVKSLMSNHVFTEDERTAFVERAKIKDKAGCQELIKRITAELQSRINNNGNATA